MKNIATIESWGRVEELPLSKNRDDYMAYFDYSDEAFEETGEMCWRLYHAYTTYVAHLDVDATNEYVMPFECSKEDDEAMTIWFRYADVVNGFYPLCKSIYADLFYPHINPRRLTHAPRCLKCNSDTCVPMPSSIPLSKEIRQRERVCIVCLEV